MYWMAWSCTSIGIEMRTVGLDVGTGRGGMWLRRPASGVEVEDDAGPAAPGCAEGVIVQPASRSARGPVWLHANAPAARATSGRPRFMARDCGPTCGSREGG